MAGPRADIRNDENNSPCYLKFPGFDKLTLVHRLLNPLGFVGFKMGRLRGGRKEHPAPFYAPIWFSSADTKMVRDVADPAAAGKQPTHFQRNPPGRGRISHKIRVISGTDWQMRKKNAKRAPD